MQILAQSTPTVRQVPYAHVGYLAAAAHSPGAYVDPAVSFAVSVVLLTLAAASLLGAVGTGVARIVRPRAGGRTVRWRVVVLVVCALVFLVAGGAFAVLEVQGRLAAKAVPLPTELRPGEPPHPAPPTAVPAAQGSEAR